MRAILERWMKFQREQSVLCAFILLALIGYGLVTVLNSEIEAFPEFTNPQVQVITQLSGKAAEEVERTATIPIEAITNGIPGLINQRSISLFGLSVVTLTFDDAYASRARLSVSQRLADVDLPEGVKPGLSPDSTPVGEIFRYTLQGTMPVDEMRMVEDWRLEREFKGIPGVADVVTFGGPIRTVEVKLDIPRMKSFGLTATAVAQALGQNSLNAGGSLINRGEEAYIVRSIGLYETPEALESAVIATVKNVPVRVRDIGAVQIGHKQRLGQVGNEKNDDAVEGIILLRQGADTLSTCKMIRDKIEKLNSDILPKDVKIVPFYDRTTLIERSSHTVFHNIVFGIILVCVMLLGGLGLRYWSMTLAVALIIPFALLCAFVGLNLYGLKPNLISLGAVDFGIIVETAIFAAEAVIVAMQALKNSRETGSVAKTLSEVLGPALLCAFLLLIAFIPIVSLQSVEGRIFRPLGITLVVALIGGQLGAFLLIPIAANFIPTGPVLHDRVEHWVLQIVAACRRWVSPLSRLPSPALVVGLICAVSLGLLGSMMGREFLPQLNEGGLYIRAIGPPTISREASVAFASQIRDKLKEIPEVRSVISQVGRPDDGTDVNGFDNVEFAVSLVHPDEWKTASTIEGITSAVAAKLSDFQGVELNYSQPIKDNVDEAISGVKGELVIKVFGPDAKELQRIADEVAGIVKSVPGAEDVGAERLLGQPELRFIMDHDLLARYGLRVNDAEDVIETSLLGKTATKLIDRQGRAVEVVVKPSIPEPPTQEVLSSLSIPSPDGARIQFGEISSGKLVEGVGRIYREGGERRIAVKCSVRGRAVVDFVHEAEAKIKATLKLPSGYRTQWSGSFENAARAGKQLMLIVPLCFLAMVIILHAWFKSWSAVGLLLWEVPFALIGGLLSLKFFALNLSISAAAGGVVLIGVSLLTGMMLISEWRRLGDVWKALESKGRSILLSSLVAIVGLIPASLSHGIGAETARPFAVIILGGLVSSLILSLTVLPMLIEASDRKRGARAPKES